MDKFSFLSFYFWLICLLYFCNKSTKKNLFPQQRSQMPAPSSTLSWLYTQIITYCEKPNVFNLTTLSRACPDLSFLTFPISLDPSYISEVVTILFSDTFLPSSGTFFHLVPLPNSSSFFKAQIQHYLLHDFFPHLSSWKQNFLSVFPSCFVFNDRM